MGGPPNADLIFVNGGVLTVTAGEAGALAVRDGRILAAGSTPEILKLRGPATETVDLAGQALLPGFIDAHTHLVSQGLKETGTTLDLSEARSRDEVLERVRRAAERGAGTWVLGHGWDESLWPNKAYLSREDLDRVAPRNPVALSRVDGHLLVANTRALELVRVDAPPDEIDRERGLFRERAVDQFVKRIPLEDAEIEAAVRAAVRRAHALGVTCVHDVVDARGIRAYLRLHRRGELRLRVRLNPQAELLDHFAELGLASGFGDGMLRLGALKLFTDGSIGARNAALHAPYADEPSTSGKLNHRPAELRRRVSRAHREGFQLMLHAIGDRAIGQALDALEAAGVGPEDRPRIEHLELPTEAQLERASALGVVASMQPNFLRWSGPGRLYETRLGPARDGRIDPHRAVLDREIPLAFGSDTMPFGPLYGIALAVGAPHPHQRLTAEEALRAYTLGAAYAGFQEGGLGSLEPGKWADLVLLSRDPRPSPEGLRGLAVRATYVAGERVYGAAA